MQRELGKVRANHLKLRLNDLQSAESMSDLLLMGGKWERLHGDRAGQWSGRLTGNWRIIVEPVGNGKAMVTVIEIVDYHKK